MCKLNQARKVVWTSESGKKSVLCFTHEDIDAAQAQANKEGCTAKVHVDRRIVSGGRNNKASAKSKPNRRQMSLSRR